MTDLLSRLKRGMHRRLLHGRANRRFRALEQAVLAAASAPEKGAATERPFRDPRPVALFNASTRLEGMSLNAGYQALTAYALRLRGVPVRHFACQGGMSRCVLAAAQFGGEALPPCDRCIAQSRVLLPQQDTTWFVAAQQPALQEALGALDLAALQVFTWQDLPLGSLCLPSLRWALRRHHLREDEATLALFRHFIASAWHVAQEFRAFVARENPRAVVVFNGMFYPEAVARHVAEQEFNLPVFTHEVGLRPFTAFFTAGDATAYPIQIPDSFQLTPAQNARLDEYLAQRRQGNFTMAGVRFWPEMQKLPRELEEAARHHEALVPVFTNVIFDTSQPHSNVLFEDMFAWLDEVLELARRHPNTLFVIRAHPDESRPGKAAAESVAQWVRDRQALALRNIHFVPPQEYISSYDLISRAKFVMVYNSTIGLEATLMGAAVLCAGKARFTQLPTVFFPSSREEYIQLGESFLSRSEPPQPPASFLPNARRFLYYQLWRSSLPFERWLEDDEVWQGYVRLRPGLSTQDFAPGSSPVLDAITSGILEHTPFIVEDQA